MKTHRRASSLFWLIIGVYTLINAWRLGIGSFHEPGPGFIFFLAALLLAGLSGLELAKTFARARPDTRTREPIWTGVRWYKVLLVLAGMSIYVYLFDVFGFLLSTFLLMVFLLKAVEPTRWWIAAMGGIMITLSCYGLFQLWLKVPFPAGVLGF